MDEFTKLAELKESGRKPNTRSKWQTLFDYCEIDTLY